jgi:hypothetical protein
MTTMTTTQEIQARLKRNAEADAARSLQFKSYLDAEGVYRWESNDAPLFTEDARAHAKAKGNMFLAGIQDHARRVYTAAIVADLRQREAVEPSAEEMFEMSAAFGKGVEVVNVLTGRRTVTR